MLVYHLRDFFLGDLLLETLKSCVQQWVGLSPQCCVLGTLAVLRFAMQEVGVSTCADDVPRLLALPFPWPCCVSAGCCLWRSCTPAILVPLGLLPRARRWGGRAHDLSRCAHDADRLSRYSLDLRIGAVDIAK